LTSSVLQQPKTMGNKVPKANSENTGRRGIYRDGNLALFELKYPLEKSVKLQ